MTNPRDTRGGTSQAPIGRAAGKGSGRFQVLAGDVSGQRWTIATSDNPAEAFAELKALTPNHHCVVWDDQRDQPVVDLDEALEILEEGK